MTKRKLTTDIWATAALAIMVVACGPTSTQKSQGSASGAAGSPEAAKAPMSVASAVSTSSAATVFQGECGTGGVGIRDCLGALPSFTAGWSGNETRHPLSDDMAKVIDDLVKNFESGSEVAVPRKSSVVNTKIWVDIEAITDANLVNPGTIKYPVVMARLTAVNKKTDNGAIDSRYNIDKTGVFYLVVSPDEFDGTPNDESRWDIVRMYTLHGQPKAEIVKAGAAYHPCKVNGQTHAQKAAPFAWFVDCSLASGVSFEDLILVKSGQPLDAAKKTKLITLYGAPLENAVKAAVENDDLIWITCGLGCCST
jgi:hypothetical protein